MGLRAEELARRFEQANQSMIDMVTACDDLGIACPAEGWTAAALGSHVGGGHHGIVEHLIKPIVAGESLPPLDQDSFDVPNARAAAENAAMPKAEVLEMLRAHGSVAAAYVRGLSDEDLDRTTTMPAFGPDPVTAEQVIEWVLIGHPLEHGDSLRQGIGHLNHDHQLQGAPA